MKYLAAYLLLNAGGNAAPSNDDIKTLLASVGVEAEDSRVASLLSAVEGKDVNELIAEGKTKLASVPSGGAVAAGAAAGGAAAGGAAEEAAEEKKEEEKEESDEDMGFGLFD
ncbi:60S acidic ribosomal protein P2 [Umbelopsis nana]